MACNTPINDVSYSLEGVQLLEYNAPQPLHFKNSLADQIGLVDNKGVVYTYNNCG